MLHNYILAYLSALNFIFTNNKPCMNIIIHKHFKFENLIIKFRSFLYFSNSTKVSRTVYSGSFDIQQRQRIILFLLLIDALLNDCLCLSYLLTQYRFMAAICMAVVSSLQCLAELKWRMSSLCGRGTLLFILIKMNTATWPPR